MSFSKTPNSPPEKRGLVMCRLLTKKTRRQAVGLVAGQVFPLPVNLQFLGFEEIDFFGVARIWMGKTGNGGLATMGVQGRGEVCGWADWKRVEIKVMVVVALAAPVARGGEGRGKGPNYPPPAGGQII